MFEFWGEEIYAKKGGWFIGLRWIAVAGGLLILLVAPFLVPLNVKYGRLIALLLMVGFVNGVYFWYWNRLKKAGLSQMQWAQKAERFLHIQMSVDLLALTLMLFFSGGTNNPLFFFYLFHLAIGAILFNWKQSLPYALSALFIPWLLYWVEPLTNPTENLWKGLTEIQPEHQKAILLAYSLTVAGLWFFLANLAGDLREKEQNLWETGEKLHVANDELKELDIFKNRFLKQVVMQVKDPLMDIGLELGKVEKSLTHPNDPSLRAVESAKKQVWALLQLIEDLVWISRTRTQDKPVKRDSVDVYEILMKCIQTKEDEARTKGIHFQLHGEPQVRLSADQESFQKVADNLIANAVQYTPEGWGDILVEFKIEGDWMEFAVEDHGIGISPKNQKNLFQEFYRGSNAKKQEKFGTGLGLSIVKSIIDLHGGKIQVRSEPKMGTRVDTWWPHVHEEASQDPVKMS